MSCYCSINDTTVFYYIIFFISYINIPVLSPIPALMILGAALSIYFSVGVAIIQSTVPDRLRGRVSSIAMMAIGLMPLGALLSGGVAQIFDARVATLGSVIFIVVILAVIIPTIGRVWKSKVSES